ncbi:MAG: hypothetical protein GT601_05850 [Acidaminobacter sp.]|uniref:PD-(D/E)XK nuclease-like domain-containing protein n=1 Tax=Acidaminobacter sp. TaxID=1872102 RepID=UPI00137E9574|nr:PD-(D/E)XK nuclease-like domain-containing protein [Acidaminobacter sp.]MZQ97179.1 hypothetical protein [Acidaminobacter sp.]
MNELVTQLNNENYFSPEMNMKYMSVSQYKDFVGTLGQTGCEARALAKLRGEWKEEPSIPMLVGSYVDSYFEGSLASFKAQNPDIFTQKGELKAQFKQAEEIIARIERDPLFMTFMNGEKQIVMTGKIYGHDFKIKIDAYHPETAIVDLKVMKSIRDTFFVKDLGRVTFVEYWGYDLQLAVYQEVVRQNHEKKLPSYLAVATKEEYPDIEIIGIDQGIMDVNIQSMEWKLGRIQQLKKGEVTPDRCGLCDYCRHTKVLKKPIHFSELAVGI